MVPTPLQSLLGLDALHGDLRTIVESFLVLGGLLGAFAVRRRKRAVTATTFLLLSGSALIDAGSRFLPNPMVLYTDFGVQPLSILTTTTVFAAVLGFALQETLGNVFSGLSLSMGHSFEPGDWIRSGTHVGRVKGISWRATTIVTRDNERLEIPNSMIAKDVLLNYATGAFRDEITIGISYGVPPNHVREVVLTLLCDVPQVMRDPPPEVLTWSYSDFSIQYHIKYWIADYGMQEHVRARVASSLWYALRRHSIEIPFPTHTIHVRDARANDEDRSDAGFERELMDDLRHVDFLRCLNDDELRSLVPTVA